MAFLLSVLFYQSQHERQFRVSLLENRLEGYSDLVDKYIKLEHSATTTDLSRLDSLKKLVPPTEIRITVFDTKGDVLYDNLVANYLKLENHFARPEFQKALLTGNGFNIRHSTTTDQEYFYSSHLQAKIKYLQDILSPQHLYTAFLSRQNHSVF